MSRDPGPCGGEHGHTAVGLVTKAPEPGRAKTRLCPPLSAEEAAAAAAAMIADTLAAARTSGYAVWVVFTGDEAVLRRTVGEDVALLAQRGQTLGERLAAAQADLFDRGFERVVLLGGDCPTVGVDTLREAVDALDVADVCVVPAVDGGYALLASARPRPEIFTEVAMGSDRTGPETVERAEAAGLRTHQLAARYDLDTWEALRAALHAGQLDEALETKALAEQMDHLPSGTRGPHSPAHARLDGPRGCGSRHAGGMAERAIGSYSHRLAAWLGARLLAGIGAPPLTLYGSGRLARLSYETGLVLAETTTGARTAVEGRRTLQVSPLADASFARMAHALVAHHLGPGRHTDRLVVALGPEAKQPARTHFREFVEALGRAAPGTSLARLSLRADPRRVGAVFMKHAAAAWREESGTTPSAHELHRLVERMVVLERDVDGDGAQGVEAKSLLAQLVRDPDQVDVAWNALVEIFAELAQQRGGCDRRGLQQRLIAAGVELETAPEFRRDVARLSRVTAATRSTLGEQRLTIPSHNGPVSLQRAVTDALERRLTQASTLVLGEAGVGKSVVLTHLLDRLRAAGVPVLALSAETTPADSLEQLHRHLGITRDLGACLTQWDPQTPGVLAVDALHAADAGQMSTWQSVLATASQANWQIVAVDRISHLRQETGLRRLFPPPSASGRGHTLPEFADLNHVHVTGLTDGELDELRTTAEEFQPLFDDPPQGLVEVLRTPFNLRLVGELLQAGIDDRSLRTIRSRLELLQQYSTWVRTPTERKRGRSRQGWPD